MSRKELLEELYKVVNKKYEHYRDEVMDNYQEDYCEEMALMYDFRKFIQYLQHNDMITNSELEKIHRFGEYAFLEDFLETFWDSDLGNSYADIGEIIRTTIGKYTI